MFSLSTLLLTWMFWSGLPFPVPQPADACPPLKLRPIDEGTTDDSFRKFRSELLAAVSRKDAQFLLSVLDPEITNSFGGDGGIEEFKTWWKLYSENSKVWETLRGVLSMGGTFQNRDRSDFASPYVFSAFPTKLDDFWYLAVISDSAELRSGPSQTAPRVATLSYDIVKLAPDVDRSQPWYEREWIKIIICNTVGFIRRRDVRSPIDYRAGFKKKDGRWRMTALVAGD